MNKNENFIENYIQINKERMKQQIQWFFNSFLTMLIDFALIDIWIYWGNCSPCPALRPCLETLAFWVKKTTRLKKREFK